MGQAHGLRVLEVGNSGKHGFRMLGGLREQDLLHIREFLVECLHLASQVEAASGGHLIVAGAGSMELARHRANFFRE